MPSHPIVPSSHSPQSDATAQTPAMLALAERTAQLEAVRAVGEEITRELDLARLLRLLIARAAGLVQATSGVVYLWEPQRELLVPGAWYGLGEWQGSIELRPGEGIAGTVAHTRQTLIVNEYRTSRYAHPLSLQHTRLTASMGEPLLFHDDLVGAITLGHEGGRMFTAQDGRVLRLFGTQAAIAIENARLYAGARRELAERTRAETALRRYQLLADHARDVVLFVRQDDGRILEANRAAVAVYGYTAAELLSCTIDDLRAPETRETIAAQMAEADERGVLFETMHQCKDGSTFPVEVSSRGADIAGERVLLSIIRDISTRYAGDRALRESEARHRALALENARLLVAQKQAYVQLQQAQAELIRTEKLRALGMMAAGIAHDLNNKLAGIQMQVELLRLPTEHRGATTEILDILETGVMDAAATVRRLRDFARQQDRSTLGRVDLGLAVQDALSLTRPRWEAESQRAGHSVKVETALDGLPTVDGHPSEIREAITNLILNGVDAMPTGGTLYITGRLVSSARSDEAPEWIELMVRDTGSGMSEEVRERAFDPFFTTKGHRGTGLGLSVVWSTMQRHGGHVTLTSSPGEGTCATLRFPAGSLAATPAARTEVAPIAGRTVLLVEDDDCVRVGMALVLRARGATVVEASDGAEALRRLDGQRFDVVLTDLGMPGASGWDVARAAKSLTPAIPVILLTGWGDIASGTESEQRHVDRLVAKPPRIPELVSAVAALCEGSRKTSASP